MGILPWPNPGTDGAELYDPSTGRFSATGKMGSPRTFFALILLTDGSVLAAGGSQDGAMLTVLTSAELYVGAAGRLTVKKVVRPLNDPGRFNLVVDGSVRMSNVGDGGTTGPLVVPAGAHLVSETPVPPTQPSDYLVLVGGDCIRFPLWPGLGIVSLAAGQSKSCTLLNVGPAQSCEDGCDIELAICQLFARTPAARYRCTVRSRTCQRKCGEPAGEDCWEELRACQREVDHTGRRVHTDAWCMERFAGCRLQASRSLAKGPAGRGRRLLPAQRRKE
jgi:hypothetical protein